MSKSVYASAFVDSIEIWNKYMSLKQFTSVYDDRMTIIVHVSYDKGYEAKLT